MGDQGMKNARHSAGENGFSTELPPPGRPDHTVPIYM